MTGGWKDKNDKNTTGYCRMKREEDYEWVVKNEGRHDETDV